MTTAQVNDFKAGETRGKLWGVTRMWLVRREDDECILLQLWKWIIEENMRAKKRHWVKRLRLSAFTTSQPRTFFWLWLMLVMWCYEYIIQFIVMVPSSSYYIIRTEILILQWNKAGMTFLNWKQLWLWNLFAILNAFMCCAGDHPATRQCGHQHQHWSGVPLLVRAFWRWSRDGSDAAGRRQRGAGPG